ncbi:MAG: hypothetical protein ACREJ2_13935 [Planctomycetota bacterium]
MKGTLAQACRRVAAGLVLAALPATLAAAQSDPAATAPTVPPASTPATPATPGTGATAGTGTPGAPPPTGGKSAALAASPTLDALIAHLRDLRAGLTDEDKPTREKALAQLDAELDRLVEGLYRVPADEDTPDERKLLAIIGLRLRAKIQYESSLMEIPAAHRAAVDAMLKKAGPEFTEFFASDPSVRADLVGKLADTKPDLATLAIFLSSALNDSDPTVATAVMQAATASLTPPDGKPADAAAAAARAEAARIYLQPLTDLLHKGYQALYMKTDQDGGNLMAMQMRMQMQMQMQGGGSPVGAWHEAAFKLVALIPGDEADHLLVDILQNYAGQAQGMGFMRMGGGAGNSILADLSAAIVKRKAVGAFQPLLQLARQHQLQESASSFNGSPMIYSSSADLFVYTAYRLIDPSVPERDAGRFSGMAWKDNAERLQFYDDFLAAWKKVQDKPAFSGYDDYEKWYSDARTGLVSAVEQETRQKKGGQ